MNEVDFEVCFICGAFLIDGSCPTCDDDPEDERAEPECPECHDLGGNRYDDGATPCPVCGKY